MERHAPRADATGEDRAVRPEYREVLLDTLAYARRNDYTGPDFADGSNSKLRRALPVESKWLNIAFQETAKRAPVDVRPLLLVESRRNPMGAALFVESNLTAHRLGRGLAADEDGSAASDMGDTDVDFHSEALSLADWLIEAASEGYSGLCWGYPHPIQYLDGRGEPGDPDVVDTAYATRALLAVEPWRPGYADAALTAANFLVEDLDYRPVEDGAVIDYHLNQGDHYTVNAGALGARLLLDLYERFTDPELLRRARAILDHVAGLQTDAGGWYYREPPDASHLSMDNHHNGFVIEAFQRYAAVVGDGRYAATLESALSFYREELYDADGAPNFDERAPYPRDVHAAAQGIVVFSYAGEFDIAERVLDWTLSELYAGDGRFYFRKHRFHTKRQVLMRWCVAWMAYAVSEFLRCRHLD